jgi:hypothetical protein
MSRTIEDLDREIQALRAEVEELKQREAHRAAKAAEALKDEEARRTEALLQVAGCFSDDPQWAAIHEKIERRRRLPDPELAAKRLDPALTRPWRCGRTLE